MWSVRRLKHSTLSDGARRRLMTSGVLTDTEATSIEDEDINFELMLKMDSPATNLRAAGCLPVELKLRGVAEATGLRMLQFDAHDLTSPAWLESAINAYGASDVRAALLVNETDAVAVAGSWASTRLGCSTGCLLRLCEGSPTTSAAVLMKTHSSERWTGVSVATLVASRLQRPELEELGMTLVALRDMGATPAQQQLMGY